MLKCIVTGALVLTTVVSAQRRVDPRNSYVRVICAVPLVGSGTPSDPKRPKYAPWPAIQGQSGIMAFFFEPSDDGRLAITEFVASSRTAFQELFDDKTITLFEKGRVPKSEVETALRQFRRDFDMDKFGMVMPGGSLANTTGGVTASSQSPYQYYLADNFAVLNGSYWTAVGSLAPTHAGLTAPEANGGSVVSRVPMPDGSSDGEARMTLALDASGGAYTLFLQASPDAHSGPAGAGTYLAFEMQNPAVSGAQCAANFVVLQSLAGSTSLLASFPHSCRNGMTMRMAVRDGILLLWPDQETPLEFALGGAGRSVTGAAQPGVGARATPPGNAIAAVQIGGADRVPPAAVDKQSIAVSAFRRRVDVQWKAATDNPGGSGIAGYWIYRDGNYLMRTTNTSFSDETVSPGDNHTYTIYAVDQHYNFSAASSVTATMPVPVKGSMGPPPRPVPLKK